MAVRTENIYQESIKSNEGGVAGLLKYRTRAVAICRLALTKTGFSLLTNGAMPALKSNDRVVVRPGKIKQEKNIKTTKEREFVGIGRRSTFEAAQHGLHRGVVALLKYSPWGSVATGGLNNENQPPNVFKS